MNFVEEFPVEWRQQLASFLWMRDIMSQDCNRSEPQIFTQWTKIGFCWYTNHKSGPGSARNSQDLRSTADFVHQLFVPALFPFPVLISDPPSLTTSRISVWSWCCYRAFLARARSHSWLMENIYLFIIQISPSQAICPPVSPSATEIRDSHNRDHQDDTWPSWVSPSPSVTITPPDQ